MVRSVILLRRVFGGVFRRAIFVFLSLSFFCWWLGWDRVVLVLDGWVIYIDDGFGWEFCCL